MEFLNYTWPKHFCQIYAYTDVYKLMQVILSNTELDCASIEKTLRVQISFT